METKKEDPVVKEKDEALNNQKPEKIIGQTTTQSDKQSFISFLLEYYRQNNGTHIC